MVGVVETHGRKETQALLEGLEIVPRRQVAYRGHALDEMDLDAILAGVRSSRWSMSSRTAMRRRAATQSDIATSRNCWPPGSTSTPR